MPTAPKFPIHVLIGAVDRISGPLGKIQKRISRTFMPLKRLQRSVDGLKRVSGVTKLSKAFGGLRSGLGQVGSELLTLGRRFALMGGIAAGAAVGIVASFARTGDLAAKTADKLGLSVEALQEWRFAADRAGVSSSTFDKSLTQFVKRVGEAKAGTGALTTFLRAQNPELLAQVQSYHDVDDAILAILGEMEKLEDVTLRNALANAAFGRSGSDFINIAKDGTQAIIDMRAEARRLGVVMDDQAARGAEEMVDRWTDLKAATSGLRNVFVQELVPGLNQVIGRITELAVGLRPAVTKWAREFASTLPDRLRELRAGFMRVVEILQPLISLGRELVERFGAVNTAVVLLAGVISAQLIVALGALVASIKAVGVAILTTPVGWILAGIAALVAGGTLLYKHWDKVASKLVGAWSFVRKSLGVLLDSMLKSVRKVVSVLPDFITTRLGINVEPTGSSGRGAAGSPPAAAMLLGRGARTETITRQEATVRVSLENLPAGSRVQTDAGGVPLELDLGFANPAL